MDLTQFFFFFVIWHLIIESNSHTHHTFPGKDCIAKSYSTSTFLNVLWYWICTLCSSESVCLLFFYMWEYILNGIDKGKIVTVHAMYMWVKLWQCWLEASGQLLYPQGKNLQYPASGSGGWPQNWPECFREEKSPSCLYLWINITISHKY